MICKKYNALGFEKKKKKKKKKKVYILKYLQIFVWSGAPVMYWVLTGLLNSKPANTLL